MTRRILLALADDTTETECGDCPMASTFGWCDAFQAKTRVRDVDDEPDLVMLRRAECLAAERAAGELVAIEPVSVPPPESRADLETAVLLLVGKACERALSKPKNRAKLDVPNLRGCVDAIGDELAETWEACEAGNVDGVIDELGDVIACAGLALWRAHGGGDV